MSVKIEQAFLSDFIAGDFGLPVHHENTEYAPEPGSPWVSVKMFENPVTAFTVADHDETDGFFQFTLHYPEGEGAMPAKAKCEEVFAAYPIGRRVTYDGQAAHVTARHRVDVGPQGGWFMVTGRIIYRAFVAR